MSDVTFLDLARAVVIEIAPEELADIEFVAEAHLAAPGAARRANRSRSEPTASGFVLGGEALSALVMAVTADVAKDLIVLGVKALGTRTRRAFRRRPVVKPDTVLPDVRDDDVRAVIAHAEAIAQRRGANPEKARTVAELVGQKWPRTP